MDIRIAERTEYEHVFGSKLSCLVERYCASWRVERLRKTLKILNGLHVYMPTYSFLNVMHK